MLKREQTGQIGWQFKKKNPTTNVLTIFYLTIKSDYSLKL